MSILDPLTCGFAKVGVYVILTQPHGINKNDGETKKVYMGRVLKHQYNKSRELYGHLFEYITYDSYKR